MRIDLKNTMRLSVVALCAVAACGGADALDTSEDDVAAAAGGALYTVAPYISSACNGAACGGYILTAVKGSAQTHVKTLDFSRSAIPAAQQHLVTEAAQSELLVRGTIDPKANSGHGQFNLTSAFRGMPGQSAAGNDAFYTVRDDSSSVSCTGSGPCNTEYATNAISGAGRYFTNASVVHAAAAFVDQGWMIEQARNAQAIAAGRMTSQTDSKGATSTVLTADQVFVKLPVVQRCPAIQRATCAAGQVMMYSRNQDRCLIPSGCVTQTSCAGTKPVCGAGYTLQSWTGTTGGCQAFACDASWLSQ